MIFTRAVRLFTLVAVSCLFISILGRPQANSKGQESPAAAQTGHPSAADTRQKPTLADVTRVSTAAAAQSAAKEQAKKEKEDSPEAAPGESPGTAVVELQPTAKDAEKSQEAVVSKDGDKSAPVKVHGRVHGSLDAKHAGNQQTGAAVGVDSKSGKPSIYVETERTRRASPPPR